MWFIPYKAVGERHGGARRGPLGLKVLAIQLYIS
jgi:hypothetical protein